MILAQVLAEYNVFSAIAETMLDACTAGLELVRHPEPIHIGIAGAIVVVLWFVLGRR